MDLRRRLSAPGPLALCRRRDRDAPGGRARCARQPRLAGRSSRRRAGGGPRARGLLGACPARAVRRSVAGDVPARIEIPDGRVAPAREGGADRVLLTWRDPCGRPAFAHAHPARGSARGGPRGAIRRGRGAPRARVRDRRRSGAGTAARAGRRVSRGGRLSAIGFRRDRLRRGLPRPDGGRRVRRGGGTSRQRLARAPPAARDRRSRARGRRDRRGDHAGRAIPLPSRAPGKQQPFYEAIDRGGGPSSCGARARWPAPGPAAQRFLRGRFAGSSRSTCSRARLLG